MKRAALFLIVVAIVLIAGGFVSYTASRQGGASIPPGVVIQTNNPEASPAAVTPDKGALFFIFAAVALGSIVGLGIVLALVFWALNWGVRRVSQLPNEGFDFTLNAATPNSIGGMLTRRPSITVAIIVLVLVVVSAIVVLAGIFPGR